MRPRRCVMWWRATTSSRVFAFDGAWSAGEEADARWARTRIPCCHRPVRVHSRFLPQSVGGAACPSPTPQQADGTNNWNPGLGQSVGRESGQGGNAAAMTETTGVLWVPVFFDPKFFAAGPSRSSAGHGVGCRWSRRELRVARGFLRILARKTPKNLARGGAHGLMQP